VNKDSHLIYEAYLRENITDEPPGGWRVKPEMAKVLDDLYSEIYDNWVPVKLTLLRGEPTDFIVFQGQPAERKMTLMDIVPSKKGEPKTLVDWIRTKIKEVITIGNNWADNDVQTNSSLIFDPRKYHTDVDKPGVEPIEKEEYQNVLNGYRQRLVGFGNHPHTMWHILDSQNVREIAPAMQRSIDNLFDLTREIIHFNRPQTPEDKYPNPGEQPPGSPTDH